MNLYSKTGDTVVFSFDKNGHKHDQDTVNKYLKLGNHYTVDRVNVRAWNSIVYLQEIPNIGFNTVHFEDVDDLKIKEQ